MTDRLVTIGPSHYCEKARWALDRAGLPFEEEAHVPLLHARAVRRAGGRRSTPVLATAGGVVLPDSTDILRWIDAHPGAAWRPYDGDREAISAFEDTLDESLGPHVRRLAYFHLMPVDALFVDILTRGVPTRERLLFRALYRPIRALMRKSMKIDAAGAERSRARIAAVLDQVDATLADGRRFLFGDRFTAADLTLASLGGYLVLAPELADRVPLDRVPAALRDEAAGFAARPSGRHILRMFAEERLVRA